MATSARQNITAIVYDKRGRIVSIGKNSYVKTHPLQAKYAQEVGLNDKVFLHAEVDALVRLRDWERAHRIVVTRVNKQGKPMLAKPCKVCQHAIKMAGIKFIEHT